MISGNGNTMFQLARMLIFMANGLKIGIPGKFVLRLQGQKKITFLFLVLDKKSGCCITVSNRKILRARNI